MKIKKRLLIAGHSSEFLGGAEDEYQKLLEFLFNKSDLYDIDAIFPEGGRSREFALYCKNYVTYERCFLPASRRPILEYFGFLKSYYNQKNIIESFIGNNHYDLCIINSSVMLWFVVFLSKKGIKLLLMVRETIKPDWLRRLLYKYYSKKVKYLVFANKRNRKEYEIITKHDNSSTLYYNLKFDIPKLDDKIILNDIGDKLYKLLKDPAEFKIMISGYVYDVKNQIMAVKSLHLMRKKGYKIPILIIKGDFSEKEKYFLKIKRFIRKYGLEENVYFVRYLEKNKYYKLFELVNALLITSKEEGCPLVLFEAMYFEKIIISTKVGGVEDLISEGVNGYFVNNEDETAERIHYIMNNEKIKRKCELNAKKMFDDKLSGNFVNEKIIKIIDNVIENK
jgi:glycosyltransferase involved in cell wall biosynthesis